VFLIALLCGGSAIPLTAWTHSEGIEAADPSTPAAVLRLESATIRYTRPNTDPLEWRELFDGTADALTTETGNNAHSGHTGAAPAIPATMQQ